MESESSLLPSSGIPCKYNTEPLCCLFWLGTVTLWVSPLTEERPHARGSSCVPWGHLLSTQSCRPGLPGDGVEPAPQHSGPHVAARRGHAGHRGPGVGADVVGLHRGQVCSAIKPTHHVDVVIEQSHASPCGEKVAQSHHE